MTYKLPPVILISIVFTGMLTGCSSRHNPTVEVTIASNPAGATAFLAGFDETFNTPKTVRLPCDRETLLVIWTKEHPARFVRITKPREARPGISAPTWLVLWGYSTLKLPVAVYRRPSLAGTWLKFTGMMLYLIPHSIAAELIPKDKGHIYVNVDLESGESRIGTSPVPDDWPWGSF